ncbi:MAG: prepilin peptidase [Candidatus Omnitrophica bacterium]|nr:prepilin peptidase [Candidatus Omnitrophota bacterium]
MAMTAFGVIILCVGVLTTFTDLKNKKIYNLHLGLGALMGLLAVAYTALKGQEHVLFHLVDGAVAFGVGFLLHRSSLWKGGDAKLFALYAFLMPPPEFKLIIFPQVTDLFACSFIAGTILLIPLLIKNIIINRGTIATQAFSPAKRRGLGSAMGTLIFYSWALFPIYYLARLTNPVVILFILYCFFNWGYSTREIKKDEVAAHRKRFYLELLIVFLVGFLSRLWLAPDSLDGPSLLRYGLMIVFSCTVSVCIHTVLEHVKEYRDRVPFAPLLFLGCLLSYTPFLTYLTRLLVRWNIFFYR